RAGAGPCRHRAARAQPGSPQPWPVPGPPDRCGREPRRAAPGGGISRLPISQKGRPFQGGPFRSRPAQLNPLITPLARRAAWAGPVVLAKIVARYQITALIPRPSSSRRLSKIVERYQITAARRGCALSRLLSKIVERYQITAHDGARRGKARLSKIVERYQ